MKLVLKPGPDQEPAVGDQCSQPTFNRQLEVGCCGVAGDPGLFLGRLSL